MGTTPKTKLATRALSKRVGREEETQLQMIRHWVYFRHAEWQIWLISIQHIFLPPSSVLSYTAEAGKLRIMFLRIPCSQRFRRQK